MKPLKQWDTKIRDLGIEKWDFPKLGDDDLISPDMGVSSLNSSVFLWRGCDCTRYDGKKIHLVYYGRNEQELKRFREEYVREGCFCWKDNELCHNVPVCPIHPYGICGIDMEMRRADTVQDGDSMMVYTTMRHWGSKESIAKIHPDFSIEYFGSWGLV